MTIDIDHTTRAVNYLIESQAYAAHIGEITKRIESWSKTPSPYGGSLAVLNPLIDIGLANRDAFERLLKLIETKRKANPTLKRMDYQRELMRQRRTRMAKAVVVHERAHGKMSPIVRKQFERQQTISWGLRREAFLGYGVPLRRTDLNDMSSAFWAEIDRELDTALAAKRLT